MHHRLIALVCWIGFAGPGIAQHDHPHSPYAGEEASAIASIGAAEAERLRRGEGMGQARAAELNHLPGPKHVLELRAVLALSPTQVAAVERIHRRMHGRAVGKGEAILERERLLSQRFAEGTLRPARVRRLARALGRLYGELRAIHLVAHLETAAELTAQQIKTYDEARGYRG